MKNNPYKITTLGEKSWRIEEAPVSFFVFEGTERALLIDTGFGAGEIKSLIKGITNLPIILINTHADNDHIGGNTAFSTAYLHPAEFANFAEQTGCNDNIRPLWEGELINLGDRTFEVILIPGHTPGSIALLDRENRIIITGDTLSSEPVYIFGHNRSIAAIIESLKKLEALSDAFDTIYPSHGSFPLYPAAITAQRKAAESLYAGELTPQEPPYELPAKMYVCGAASFFL